MSQLVALQSTSVSPPAVPPVSRVVADNPELNQWLISVVQSGSVDDYQRLIDDGANVNCCDSAGWRPIQIAAWRRRIPMLLAILMTPGVDVEALGPSGTRT